MKEKIKEKDVIHKIVPIEGNFIDYLLKRDPDLPNRMLENSIREDERKRTSKQIFDDIDNEFLFTTMSGVDMCEMKQKDYEELKKKWVKC